MYAPTCKVGVHICKHIHTYVNSYTHTVSCHIYIYTSVYMHTHAQTQIRMYVFLCAHNVSVSTHGVFRVYMYKCTHIHTHIKHTCKQDTNTDMNARICIHTSCMNTRCLLIHICIDVHIYTRMWIWRTCM